MSHTLTDLLRTDAELDLIAARDFDAMDDLVLAGLAELAMAVDEQPAPTLELARPSRHRRAESDLPVATRPMSRTRKGGFALTATVALMLSSSGLAAAVSGDPLAPFHFVVRHVLGVGSHDSGQIPGWDLSGASSVSLVRHGAVSMSPLGRPSGASVASLRDSSGLGTGSHRPGEISRRGNDGPGGPPRSGHGHHPRGPIDRGRGPAGGDPGEPIVPSQPTDPRHGRHGSGGGGTHPTAPPQQSSTEHASPGTPHPVHPSVAMSRGSAVPAPATSPAGARTSRGNGRTVSPRSGSGT